MRQGQLRELEAFLVIKNRADHDRILVNDIRVRLLNLDQITFGQVLEQCLKIWHLTGYMKKQSTGGSSPLKNGLKLDLGYLTSNDTYFLGDAEGNVFLNHASIEGLFSESLLSFQDPNNAEQQIVYLHRSSVLHESSVPDSARESLNAAKIEIQRSNMSLQENESRNQGDDLSRRMETNESDSKYKQSQFSKRSKENTSQIRTPNEMVHPEVEEELEETPAHRHEEEKKQVSVQKAPFSSDDSGEGVDIYNEDYDDDDTIEATRRGSSIYMNAHKVRLYTPSNTSSHAGGVSQDRNNKSKSHFHISDNEDVLTMSDIDVSHDRGEHPGGRSIQGTSSIMKQGDVFIDDGKDEEELQILSGSGSEEGVHRLTKVGSRQRYEEVPQFQKYYVKNATITFKEKMNLLKKQDAERKSQFQHHAHHSSDVTDNVSKRSHQYSRGTMVLQSRMESERYPTEPQRYDPTSEHNFFEPDPITGGGIVTSSGIRTSQTGSQEVSSRDYKRPNVQISEIPESSSQFSQYHHSYSRSSVPHTTSHAEQKKVIFEYVNESKLPNRSNTLDRDYTSVPEPKGRLLNKLQQDLEQINREHLHSHDLGAPRSLQAQDISKSPHQTLRSGKSLLGEERLNIPSLVSPSHISHYKLRYGKAQVPQETSSLDVSPVRARLYPTNLERRRY